MPKISHKAQLATDYFIANTIIAPIVGYSWAKAMKQAGYAISTCEKHPERVTALVGVKNQIEAARAKIGRKAENIRDKVARMYEAGYKVAEAQSNPTGMATNVTGLARMNGLLTDNVNTENKVLSISVKVRD